MLFTWKHLCHTPGRHLLSLKDFYLISNLSQYYSKIGVRKTNEPKTKITYALAHFTIPQGFKLCMTNWNLSNFTTITATEPICSQWNGYITSKTVPWYNFVGSIGSSRCFFFMIPPSRITSLMCSYNFLPFANFFPEIHSQRFVRVC